MTKQTQSKALTVSHTQVETVEPKAIPNMIDYLSIGKDSIKLIDEGSAKTTKGICLMTYVISQIFYGPDFTTSTSGSVRKFTLDDVARGYEVTHYRNGNPMAKRDNGLSAARLNVIANQVFGIEARTLKDIGKTKKLEYFTVSQKNSFNKALNLVKALVLLEVPLHTFVQLKDSTLYVPNWLLVPMPETKDVAGTLTYNLTKNEMFPVINFAAFERNVDKLLEQRGHKAKRAPKSGQGDATVIFMGNLETIVLRAKSLTDELTKGEILKVDTDQRKKMQEAFNALAKLFETEKKAEQDAEAKEQAERQSKVKKAS